MAILHGGMPLNGFYIDLFRNFSRKTGILFGISRIKIVPSGNLTFLEIKGLIPRFCMLLRLVFSKFPIK